MNILENLSLSFHYEKKRYGTRIFINKYILIMCAISILKAGSLYSSVANIILRLLVEGQINIFVKYEMKFNDVTKQQAGRTTHAPEQRP